MKQMIVQKLGNQILNFEEFKAFFLSLKDGKTLIEAKDARRRSKDQNAYYWAVIVPTVKKALRDAGFDEVQDDEDAHEVMIGLFLKKYAVNKATGETLDINRRTSKLTVSEFNEYLDKISRWSAEYLGTVIPSPYEIMNNYQEWQSALNNETD